MPQTKEQKQRIIEEIKEKIGRQKIIIFASISGLKVKPLFSLRKKLKTNDCQLLVAKKSLIKLALEKQISGVAEKIKELSGEIALIFGFEEEISPAKIAYVFSGEQKNFKILGGIFENGFVGAEEIITLAQIPSREGLLTQLVGTIASPASNFINILEGNIKGLIYALCAIKNK